MIGSLVGLGLGILVLAFVGEAIVEYLIKDHLAWVLGKLGLDEDVEAVRDIIGKYSAAIVGVLLCFLYQVDGLSLFDMRPVWEPGSYVLTGLLIGRGSNFVHNFMKRYILKEEVEFEEEAESEEEE
jgi:hypothetical protein